jgi:hypothetical protein
MGDRGVRKPLVAERPLNASPPLRRGFRHETRACLSDLENVVVPTKRIARVNDFVVRRLRIHLYSDSVAFAADAFDLNHDLSLGGGASTRLLDGGSLTTVEEARAGSARTFDHLGDALRQSNCSTRVSLEYQTERAPLAVERGQQLSSAIWGRHDAVHQLLERCITSVWRLCHACFDVPARAVVLTESRARRARSILDAYDAERDVAQQIRTWNERHLGVFLEYLSQLLQQFGIASCCTDQLEPTTRVRFNAHASLRLEEGVRRYTLRRNLLPGQDIPVRGVREADDVPLSPTAVPV